MSAANQEQDENRSNAGGPLPLDPPAIAEVVAETPPSGCGRVRFLAKVLEVRLRFVAILIGTFLVIRYWDTIGAEWAKWTRPTSTVTADASVEYYCPMHPSVVRDSLEPNGELPKCPICGMPLSQRKKGEKVKLPAGVLARVELKPEQIEMAGINTAEADYRPLAQEIRTVGFVEYDETGRSRVVTRVAGYVEKLYVDKWYVQVDAGEPLVVIYSPELYGTELELVLALNRGAADLVKVARERLKLYGVGDPEIDQIVATKKASTGLVIRSPTSGHVIVKNVVQEAQVETGATLFELADLSTVWVEAEVFERDMPLLVGQPTVEVSVEGIPDRKFAGKVLLVHPHIETETRTNRVRVELPNPGHLLRPGMFANVSIHVPNAELEPFKSRLEAARRPPAGADDKSLIAFQKTCPVSGLELGTMGDAVKRQVGKEVVFLCCPDCVAKFDAQQDHYLAQLKPPPDHTVLTIPERAVIDTGKKKLVYLERTPGVFDAIEVEVGPLSNGLYPVVKGLAVGDRVAAAGAFLIDAETRINPAAGAAYVGASK